MKNLVDVAYDNGKKLLRGSYTEYTPAGKGNFVREGAYGKIPHKGDIVYFYTASLGRVSHVGIVVSVTKSSSSYSIQTIEGNTSAASFERNGGAVAIKEYRFILDEVGGRNRIDGFGSPAYGDNTCTVEEMVEIARNEVGYLEKASNRELLDKKANAGDRNFTKYGEWYGDNGAYWCQQFVSWCAYMACKKHLGSTKKQGWLKAGEFWTYYDQGTQVKDKWIYDDKLGQWFVFDGAGHMTRGWFKVGDDWYYLNDDGAMLSGQWIDKDGKWYYLSSSGVMAKNAYVRDDKGLCKVNSDGVWDGSYVDGKLEDIEFVI